MSDHHAAAALDALMAEYAKAWRGSEPDALHAFWDPGHPPVYLAEEMEEAFMRWEEVEAYWSANRERHAGVELAFSQPCYVDIADGLVMGVHRMDWSIRFADRPAMGGDNRVAALYRETGEGWRIAAWIEAPLAPIVYLRKLYQARA